jgi:hypothetical protein
MSRTIADKVAAETARAAKVAERALVVDLAQNGVDTARQAYEALAEEVKRAGEAIVQETNEAAAESARAWGEAGIEIAGSLGETLAALRKDSETAEEALLALAETFLMAMLDAAESAMLAEIGRQEDALHAERLMRIEELTQAKMALAAKEAALHAAKMAMEKAEKGAEVATATVEQGAAMGTATVVKGAQEMEKQAILETAAANIAKAGTGAAGSQASIPIMGPILAAAAASAIVSLLRGLVGGLFAAEGGFVEGGIRRKDSVGPAYLMPGEYVMSVPEVQGMRSFMGQMGASSGGSPSSPPAVHNYKTEVTIKPQQLPNRMETARWLKSTVMPASQYVNARGY